MTVSAQISTATAQAQGQPRALALAIDLDGTLVAGDMLTEAVIWLLFNRPLRLLTLSLTLSRGRAAFKRGVADAVGLVPEQLAYRKDVLALARAARSEGAGVHLVTGADQRIADRVASHLGIFNSATGSDGSRNLVGREKAAHLVERFPAGFHYVGDSRKDRPVWLAAAEASVVATTPARARRLIGATAARFTTIPAPRASLKDWIKAVRLHHWVKNALIFVPVILGQLFDDQRAISLSAIGFLVFGLVASAGYLINDLGDIGADRAHPRKRKRAIAAGRIPAATALGLAALMATTGLALAAFTDGDFALWASIHFALSLAYTFKLKREPLVDIFTIGVLFTIRLIAGMVILDQAISVWLTSFSFALFASLAFAKRTGELTAAAARGGSAPAGRGYQLDDRYLLASFGVATAIASLIVMLLYFQFRALSTGLYDNIEWLYFAPVVLLSWLQRVWIRAYRGVLHDDPIIFALKDRASWLHFIVIVLIWQIADKPGFPQ